VIHRLLTGAILALAATLAACSYTLDATRVGVPVTLATSASTPAPGTPFEVHRKPVYLLWGVVTANPANLDDELVGQLGIGSGLANVRVRVRSTPVDVLITVLTGGVVVPRTVTIAGVVVPR
jgi:hypothetical protein